MNNLLFDIRFALRMLRKAPAVTAAALVALALGIGATSAIFSMIDATILRPLPFREPDRLVVLVDTFASVGLNKIPISPNELFVFRERSRSFEGIGAYGDGMANLTGVDTPVQLKATYTTANFFQVMGVQPLLGRAFEEGEDKPSAQRVLLLGHALWRGRFGGDPGVVGRSIMLDGEPHTIVGVLPAGFDLPHGSDLWTPLPFTPEQTEPPSKKGGRFMTAIARLKPGLTIEDAEKDMLAVGDTFIADFGAPYSREHGWSANVVPLRDRILGDNRTALLMILGAVLFVLLIACANVANLLLARAAVRRREIAVRAALGASRARLAAQLLVESVVLSLAGSAAGLLVALWGLDALVALIPPELAGMGDISLNGRVLAFTLVVSVLTGLLFGVLPALHASRTNPAEVLKDGVRGTAGGRAGRVRSALVVAQVALAFVLLVGAGLMVRSLAALTDRSPGYDTEGIVSVSFALTPTRYKEPHAASAFFDELGKRARALPGVEGVGLISILPLTGRSDWNFEIEGREPDAGGISPNAQVRRVDPAYLSVMKVPLLAGRHFASSDTKDAQPVAIVNQALVKKYFQGRDPLGARLKIRDEPPRTIVGVVGDTRDIHLHEEPHPTLYLPYWQSPNAWMALVARTSLDLPSFGAALRKEVRGIDADEPVSAPRTMRGMIDETLGSRRLQMTLLAIFAAVAVVLAAVGIYGVTAYSVAQRTREIGIRMALGAQAGMIVRSVVGQALRLTLSGLAAGILAALALSRVIASLVYGVPSFDPLTLLAIAPLLALTALLASYLPARKAARVDPVTALRAE